MEEKELLFQTICLSKFIEFYAIRIMFTLSLMFHLYSLFMTYTWSPTARFIWNYVKRQQWNPHTYIYIFYTDILIPNLLSLTNQEI